MKAMDIFDIEAYCDKQREEWETSTRETPFDKWLCIKMSSLERRLAAFTITNAQVSDLRDEVKQLKIKNKFMAQLLAKYAENEE